MSAVYLVVKRDEQGMVFETRVLQHELAEHIKATFENTTIQILAIIKL